MRALPAAADKAKDAVAVDLAATAPKSSMGMSTAAAEAITVVAAEATMVAAAATAAAATAAAGATAAAVATTAAALAAAAADPLPMEWQQTPSSVLQNWHYCHMHGGNVEDNHTSATCACPGKHHQRAATHANTMGGNTRGMHKTILPSAVGCTPPTPRPPPHPINYAPTFSAPFGANRPHFPMTPGSWGFRPHAAAYAQANNTPPAQLGTAMIQNAATFHNGYPYGAPMPAPPTTGQAITVGNPVGHFNNF